MNKIKTPWRLSTIAEHAFGDKDLHISDQTDEECVVFEVRDSDSCVYLVREDVRALAEYMELMPVPVAVAGIKPAPEAGIKPAPEAGIKPAPEAEIDLVTDGNNTWAVSTPKETHQVRVMQYIGNWDTLEQAGLVVQSLRYWKTIGSDTPAQTDGSVRIHTRTGFATVHPTNWIIDDGDWLTVCTDENFRKRYDLCDPDLAKKYELWTKWGRGA